MSRRLPRLIALLFIAACNTVLGLDDDQELLPVPGASELDAGQRDGAALDASSPDANLDDASQLDASQPDASQPDASQPDASPPDASGPLLELLHDTKLLANDGASLDQFGYSVSLDGDTAVVGALSSDSVYVFLRSGSNWLQQARFTGTDTVAGDQFGISVSVNGDTIVVGARSDDDDGISSGSAYVFLRTGTAWAQQAKLTASDAAAGDDFGWSVAVHGETALIGAPLADDIADNSGSAYAFLRTGTSWAEQTKLVALDPVEGGRLGSACAIHADTAVLGAPGSFGAAYSFVRTGTTWAQQGKLTASDGAAGDRLGEAVAVDGDTAVAGAVTVNEGAINNSGAAYVFVRMGTSWSEQAKLTGSIAPMASDLFGYSVAIEGDTIVVGSRNEEDEAALDTGLAYLFSRSGTTWSPQMTLESSDALGGDRIGASIAIDGNTVLVGAELGFNASSIDTGAAYVFEH